MQRISALTLVVADYDEAIAWYRDALGFVLLEDTVLSAAKRWVRMAPAGGGPHEGTALLLAKAVQPEQAARIGDQTGGRVFLFLDTDDFARDHARLSRHGAQFEGAPRDEDYGRVVVFRDLFGNRWDLVERRR